MPMLAGRPMKREASTPRRRTDLNSAGTVREETRGDAALFPAVGGSWASALSLGKIAVAKAIAKTPKGNWYMNCAQLRRCVAPSDIGRVIVWPSKRIVVEPGARER